MKLYAVVRKVAEVRGKSIYRVEHDLGFSNGTISKWDYSMPRADKLQAVANYLDTTVSVLLDEAAQTKQKEDV